MCSIHIGNRVITHASLGILIGSVKSYWVDYFDSRVYVHEAITIIHSDTEKALTVLLLLGDAQLVVTSCK